LAKLTLVFAALLVALGLAGYLGTGSLHPTALIPTWIGLALGIFGFLAISPNESRRKLFMHINVTIALLGFIGSTVEAIRGYVHAKSMGSPDQIALGSKTHAGRPAADLRDSLRALIHRRAPFGEGLDLGNHAQRRLGMGGSRAERSPRHGGARAGGSAQAQAQHQKAVAADLGLVKPRMGLLIGGLCLMVINRVAGLVLPYTSKTLLDKVLSTQHPHPDLLPKIIALSSRHGGAGHHIVLADAVALQGRPALIAEMRRQVQRHVGCSRSPTTTRTAPARWFRAS
jgi:hypothetical protein